MSTTTVEVVTASSKVKVIIFFEHNTIISTIGVLTDLYSNIETNIDIRTNEIEKSEPQWSNTRL